MSIADRYRAEGWKIGWEEGNEKARAEVYSEVAVLLLTERFGKLPQDIKQGIVGSRSKALELILLDIFTYENIEDVRRYIPS